MLKYAATYGATAVAFFVIDFIWLSTQIGTYRRELGSLLLDKPNLGVAALFYVLYVVGIVLLAIRPALAGGNWWEATLLGALLGLVAYGTYDVTNLSTIKGWSVTITAIDLAWGTFLTATAATAGFFVARMVP